MAFKRMRRGRFGKKTGNWAGITEGYSPNFLAGTDIRVSQIWAPIDSDTMNLTGKGGVRRIVGDINVRANGLTLISWYLAVFQTDDTETPPSALIISPFSADADFIEKRFIAYGQAYVANDAATSGGSAVLNIPIDFAPRGHVITNEDCLCLVLAGSNGSNTGNNVNLRLRAYCSW